MKKKISLLVGVLLILSVLFAACSQQAATTKSIRWEEQGESYSFKISLSDFSNDGNTLFNSYSKKIMKTNSNGESKEETITCYKDNVISSDATVFANADQLRPIDACGTYTMSISRDTSTSTLVTEQVIYSQYDTSKLQELNCLDKLSAYVVNDNSLFANNAGRTVLRSTTMSTVIFANTADQQPEKSTLENKGFYIGKIYQGASDYKYETTYDIANRKVTVSKNGGEAEERTLNIAKKGTCIDSSQLLLYVRSLDKSSAAFADNPSVAVYDVTTDLISTASFAINRDFNLILNGNGEETVATVHAVNVAVGGMPFMAQYNLPNISKINDEGEGYDYIPLSGDRRCKYTTLKFRSGWYSYEMVDYSQPITDAVNAITLLTIA